MNAKRNTPTCNTPNPTSELPSPEGWPVRIAKAPSSENMESRGPAGLRSSGIGRISDFGTPVSGVCNLSLALAACVILSGCGLFKPAHDTTRHFALTPLPDSGPEKTPPSAIALGVGQVKLPAYLFDLSLAVRKGTNEIDYLPFMLWAERLDTGVQRVLAANLATLLPTDQIRLTAWRSDEVTAEVYVVIQRFDVDSSGQAVLVAWWRILSPGGEKTLKSGETRLARHGPPPETSPSGAVATLSNLMAELSRQLAQALKEKE